MTVDAFQMQKNAEKIWLSSQISKAARHCRYPAKSEARIRMLYEPGHLYAAYSRYCDWIKLGFTSKGAPNRLEGCAAQYAEFAPFSLIGVAKSTWRAEQQLHRLMRPFLQNKTASTAELYPAVPAVVEMVKFVLSHPTWSLVDLDRHRSIRDWVRVKAGHPLNRVLANESFSLFFAERSARRGSAAEIMGEMPAHLRQVKQPVAA
ncbi:MAG: hypothetical protein JSR91_00320 [Proteobacteria bacterium]|nr:hypothetical protein [Pseudomonadota bacterium]